MNIERYARQTLFPPVGKDGQKRLAESAVTIVGCGALGTRSAEILARAGIGAIKIVDRDFVETINLQRQTLFDESDANGALPKAIAAEKKLRSINSEIAVNGKVADITSQNVLELVKDSDVVVDGLDNFETRYLINDACLKLRIPWIYGACVGSYGATMNILPGETPCLRCVFPEIPPTGGATCETVGVLAGVASIVSSYQTTEALKILLGKRDAIRRTLLSFDIWLNKREEIRLPTKFFKDCPACGKKNFEFLKNSTDNATKLCGQNAVQVRSVNPPRRVKNGVDFDLLSKRLSAVGAVKTNKYLLQFEIDKFKITLFKDGRAIVAGTNDPAEARSLYAKYIGS